MADYDNRTLRSVASGTAVIDAGLRAYMLRVYNYMLVGLCASPASTAWVTANTSFGELVLPVFNPATHRFGMTISGLHSRPLCSRRSASCCSCRSGSTG